MTPAILSVLIASGFWGAGQGHWERSQHPDLETCNRARPGVEVAKRAMGQVVMFTICRAATEGGI